VDLRNELVHHWMRKRPSAFDSRESRLAMIDELESAARQLQDMAEVLRERMRGFLRHAGVDEARSWPS